MKAPFLCFLFLVTLASAQAIRTDGETPRVEVFGGYSHLHTTHAAFNGWEGAGVYNFNRSFGIRADFAGDYDSMHRAFTGLSESLHISAYNYSFGPQVSWRLNRATIFGYGLLGGVHQHARLRLDFQPAGPANSFDSKTNSFAITLGGGADWNLKKHLAWRIAQVDYLRMTRFEFERNNVRLATGLVLGIGRTGTDSNVLPSTDDFSTGGHRNEFGFWSGGSPNSNRYLGQELDRQLFLAGLRYGRVLVRGRGLSFKYNIDVIPAAFVDQTDLKLRKTRLFDQQSPVFPDHTFVYGAGASPVGFQLNVRERRRYQPYVAGSVGMLYFSRDVPAKGAAHFNFTAEWGGGLQMFLKPQKTLSLGYKYHHISNAFTSSVNPGVDSNVIYLGYSFYK